MHRVILSAPHLQRDLTGVFEAGNEFPIRALGPEMRDVDLLRRLFGTADADDVRQFGPDLRGSRIE